MSAFNADHRPIATEDPKPSQDFSSDREASPQRQSSHSQLNPATRPIKAPIPIVNKIIGRIHVSASLEQWQYGTWLSKSACLIVVEWRFHPGFRIPKANIDVTFQATLDTSDDDVTIEAFGPSTLYGSDTTKESVQSEFSATPQVTLAGGPASVGVSLSDSHTSSYDKLWQGLVEGDSSPYPGHATKNHIAWCLHENAKQGGGVPRRLRTAIIVTYKADFNMNCAVRITGTTKQWWRITWNPVRRWYPPLRNKEPIDFEKPGTGLSLKPGPSEEEDTDKQGKKPVRSDFSTSTVPIDYEFSKISLQQWRQLLQPEWTSEAAAVPDPNASIYAIIHDENVGKKSADAGTTKETSPALSSGDTQAHALELIQMGIGLLNSVSKSSTSQSNPTVSSGSEETKVAVPNQTSQRAEKLVNSLRRVVSRRGS